MSAEITARKKAPKNNAEALKVPIEKRGRGRPTPLRYSEIYGHAENYRGSLENVWDRLWPALSNAQNEQEVATALREYGRPYDQTFGPLAALIVGVLQEDTFPKRARSQQRYLADSLAAFGKVSPRRSRDICAQERMKAKRAHHIVRYEYYVECSCGYDGPARDHACRKCGATIPPHLFG